MDEFGQLAGNHSGVFGGWGIGCMSSALGRRFSGFDFGQEATVLGGFQRRTALGDNGSGETRATSFLARGCIWFLDSLP
jgi:hypothetical protein